MSCFICGNDIYVEFTYCGKDFCRKCEHQLRMDILKQIMDEEKAFWDTKLSYRLKAKK